MRSGLGLIPWEFPLRIIEKEGEKVGLWVS